MALVIALLLRRSRRMCRAHDRPIRMELLSEDEEKRWLSAADAKEEALGAAFHDVYQCPECGHIRQLSFKRWLTGKRRCPRCRRHTVAKVQGERHSASCGACGWSGDLQPIFQRSGADLPPEGYRSWEAYHAELAARAEEEPATPPVAPSSHRPSPPPDDPGGFGGGRSGGGGAGSSW